MNNNLCHIIFQTAEHYRRAPYSFNLIPIVSESFRLFYLTIVEGCRRSPTSITTRSCYSLQWQTPRSLCPFYKSSFPQWLSSLNWAIRWSFCLFRAFIIWITCSYWTCVWPPLVVISAFLYSLPWHNLIFKTYLLKSHAFSYIMHSWSAPFKCLYHSWHFVSIDFVW